MENRRDEGGGNEIIKTQAFIEGEKIDFQQLQVTLQRTTVNTWEKSILNRMQNSIWIMSVCDSPCKTKT